MEHVGAGDVAIMTFQTPYCKTLLNEGEGEGGGKFLIPSSPSPPSPMARLKSAKEVKVSRTFGLSVRRHHGKQYNLLLKTEKCLNYE